MTTTTKPAAARRGLRTAVIILAAGGLVLPVSALAAPPTLDEREAAVSAVRDGEAVVTEMRTRLAAAQQALSEAEVRAGVAAENYLDSQQAAETARATYEVAEAEARAAEGRLAQALDDLAAVAIDAYRRGGNVSDQARILFGAEGLDEVLRTSSAYARATGANGSAATSAEDARAEAQVARSRADGAQRAYADRAERAETAKAEADVEADQLATQRTAVARDVDAAVQELGALRAHSDSLEQAYQDFVVEQQRLREEAERQAALAAQQGAGASEGSGTSVPATGSGPTGSAGGGTQEPAPEPSAAPSPEPSTAPDPEPSKTEAPAPAPSPSPTKTQAPAPAPSPTKTQAPAPAPSPSPSPSPTKTQAPSPSPSPTKTQAPTPPPVTTPPPTTGASVAARAVDAALSQVGKPYVLGATGPNSYDCSGLVQWAYKQAGASLPRTSRQQWSATTRVSESNLRPGDLIFYSNNGTGSGVYHVAIYTGPGMRVHAPSPGKTVEHVKIWNTNVIGYGRVS